MPTWRIVARSLLGMEGGTVGINGSGHWYEQRNKDKDRVYSNLQEKCPAGIEGLAGGKRKVLTWALIGSQQRNNFVKDSECCLFKTFLPFFWQSTQVSWHRGPNTRAWSLLWVGINS